MNANVIIIPGSDLFLQQRKLQPKQARILFDPPNQKRVLVIYWRGAKHGFYDAIVEDIDKNNRLLHKFPVRHEYLAGQRKDKLRQAAHAEYDKGCDLPDISMVHHLGTVFRHGAALSDGEILSSGLDDHL